MIDRNANFLPIARAPASRLEHRSSKSIYSDLRDPADERLNAVI